eukprot:9178399-Alexandrium_andersonii.AAC.1
MCIRDRLGAPGPRQSGLDGPESKEALLRPVCCAFRWGEARHPGPVVEHATVIETVNITSASTYWQAICERDACC